MGRHEKNMLLTTREYERKTKHHNASVRRKKKNIIERMDKKRTTSDTKELEKGILRIRVERSCWKNNNEKSKLVVGLWKTSQNL